jgi:Cu/Ag efflux protein CusF
MLFVPACTYARPLELSQDHPANPKAPVGTVIVPSGLSSYKTAARFADQAVLDRVAQTASAGHSAMPGTGHAGPLPARQEIAQQDAVKPTGTGTVNGVDMAKRTVNLTHEPIPTLGWPTMTMDFAVAPSVDLAKVAPGAKVRFTLAREKDGIYVIETVQPLQGASGPGQSGGAMPKGHEMPSGSMGHGMQGGEAPSPGKTKAP